MKILLGIDTVGHYKAALNLAARLKLPNPLWTLAHSVDVNVPIGGYGINSEEALAIDFYQFASHSGREALEKAKDEACAHGINAETALLNGNAASALAQYADAMHADFVCVQSERKGRLGSMFFGSVSRGLAIGSSQSVLISKGWVAPNGELSAVFATDHSEYADKALEKFIQMAPQGIRNIKVVTALHLDETGGRLEMKNLDNALQKWLVERPARKNGEAVAKLTAAGYRCTSEVYNLPVNEALDAAMTSTHADLLVMGAQGHGFMHRLFLGSTALHQVVMEPHRVLILRP